MRLLVGVALALAACESPPEPPPLDPPLPPASRGPVRVAGAGVMTPLVSHLTAHFTSLRRGRPIDVAPPLGGEGALQALDAGALHAALVATGHGVPPRPGALALATARVVLAVGPGVTERRLTRAQLAALLRGEPLPTGYPRTVLLRPAGDVAQDRLAAADPVLGQAFRDALGARRWRVVYGDDDFRDALARTPGAIGVSDLGSLRLRATPVWMAELDPPARLELTFWMVLGERAPARLRAFVEFATGEGGRPYITDLGYGVPR